MNNLTPPPMPFDKNNPQPPRDDIFKREYRDRRSVAENVLAVFGKIDWHDEITGYIPCPGRNLHSTEDGYRDCQVKIDGTPTLYCQHQSCKNVITETNRALRMAMNAHQRLGILGDDERSYSPKNPVEQFTHIEAFGAHILKEVRNVKHEGALEALHRSSPVLIPDDNNEQFKMFMSLLPPDDVIWIGNKEDSGLPRHSENFKSAKSWASDGAPKFPLICTSSFKLGSFSRSKKNATKQNLIVFECDRADLTLAKKVASKETLDESDKRRNKEISVALISRLQKDLKLKLVAVVDSGNKSLHAYFRYPGEAILSELKHFMPAMGGDPMVLGSASASRLPGYQDDERKQSLLYFDNGRVIDAPQLPSSLIPPLAFEQFGQKELTSLNSFSAMSDLPRSTTVSSLNSYPAATPLVEPLKLSSLNSSSGASSLTRPPPVNSLNSSTDVVKITEVGSTGTRTQKRIHKVAKNMPRPLQDIAFHGVAGRIVRKIEPHTEASPAALLMTLLTFAGSMIGKGAYVMTDGAKQCMNLFTLIIGSSSKARKGTSLANIERVLRMVDANFMSDNTASGLSTGEGLIAAVKDSVTKQATNQTTGILEEKVLELGVDDKRLIVAEGEFANALKVAKREGNILSGILRNAWDGRDLRIMTRKDPLRSTAPHISILAHITREELLKEMSEVDTVNGFANRFLFVASERQKLLPEGGDIGSVDFQKEIDDLTQAINRGQTIGKMTRSSEAATLWESTYAKLAKARPGLIGCITSRSEAQVTRLSALYALLDGSSVINSTHHEAALEVWRYCEESAHWIFGMKTGHRLSDKILDALHSTAPEAMSRTEIFTKVMGRNGTAQDLNSALRVLLEYELIECWEEKATDGRVTELFRYVEGTNYTNSAKEPPPSEEATGSITTTSQAGFVQFVAFNEGNAVVASTSQPNGTVAQHTTSSSHLSPPNVPVVTRINPEYMCDEEREHWDYYHAYVEMEHHQ